LDREDWSYTPNVRPEECLRFNKKACTAGIYKDQKNLLVLGDGDMSFSLSLSSHLKSTKANLISTTYLSLGELHKAYSKTTIDKTIKQLGDNGAAVHHDVDATEIELQVPKGTVAVFNFPCVPG